MCFILFLLATLWRG